MQVGQYLGTRNVTAVDTVVPTTVADGWDLAVFEGGSEVRDRLTLAALFTAGTAPYVEIIPYWWFPGPGVWVPKEKFALYPHAGITAALPGLKTLDVPGGATRMMAFVITYSGTPTSVDLYAIAGEEV